MRIYVITENPSDYPGKFVVRGLSVKVGGNIPDPNPTHVCDTLEEARFAVPEGLCLMMPDPEDDPVIREFWL